MVERVVPVPVLIAVVKEKIALPTVGKTKSATMNSAIPREQRVIWRTPHIVTDNVWIGDSTA